MPTINVLEQKKKNIIFHLKINIFTAVQYRCNGNGINTPLQYTVICMAVKMTIFR